MDNDELLIAIKDMFEKKIDEVKSEVKNEVNEVKNHMGVIAESLRSEIKAVAEGHNVLDKKIDEKTNELKAELKIVADYIIGVDAKLNEHEIILKRVK